VIIPASIELPGPSPGASHRIIKLAGDDTKGLLGTSCDQHPPIGNQCRGVAVAGSGHVAAVSPVAGDWVVEFRAVDNNASGWVLAACHQHRSILEQRRSVTIAPSIEAAGILPLAGSSRAWLRKQRGR